MMEIIGQGESLWGHATFCVMGMVVAIFTIFVVLQVAGYIHWNWWHVFTPLYIVFASFCCAPCLKWPATYSIKIGPCVAVYAFLGLPLLCFALLLNIRLVNEHAFSMAILLIPLWVLDGMMFGAAATLAIGEGQPLILFSWLCLDGPLVIFKILLAFYVGGSLSDKSASLIFIPLYLTQFALLIGAAVLSCIISDDGGIDYDDEPAPFNMPMPPV